MEIKNNVISSKKYEILSDDTRNFIGCTLYRIRALRDIPNIGVKKGDLGGYIMDENNLSHDGDCWVFDRSIVCDRARVYENGVVYDNSTIACRAQVYGNAKVYDDTWVYDDAKVYCNARVCEHSQLYGNKSVSGDMEVRNEVIGDGEPIY